MNAHREFTDYIVVAADYAARKLPYSEVERARAFLCAALDYPRVTDYLGEFCNLHERDIPGHKAACQEGPDSWRYSGFSSPVSRATLDQQLADYERRSAELIEWFHTAPVERFIAGHRVIYKGLDEGKCYMARFIRAEVPYLRINEIIDLFEYPVRQEPIMGEIQARSFFANLPEPFFTAHFKQA